MLTISADCVHRSTHSVTIHSTCGGHALLHPRPAQPVFGGDVIATHPVAIVVAL